MYFIAYDLYTNVEFNPFDVIYDYNDFVYILSNGYSYTEYYEQAKLIIRAEKIYKLSK